MKPSDNDEALNSRELNLQKQAKARLRISASPTLLEFERLSSEEKQGLLDELQAHEVQMNMQNEELCLLQTALDAAHLRYFQLYNHAPMGYCSVSKHGLILQSNLKAANLLSMLPAEAVGCADRE